MVVYLQELSDAGERCLTGKKQGFNKLMMHAYRSAVLEVELPAVDDHALFRREFGRFLDDYKTKAFASAIVQPAVAFLELSGEKKLAAAFESHGFNWYKMLLREAVGLELAEPTDEDDTEHSGVVDFWSGGLSEEAWTALAMVENFGQRWQKAKVVKSMICNTVVAGEFPLGTRTATPRQLVSKLQQDASVRQALSVYVRRFSHFFERERFVQYALTSG
eukprot:6993497-Prymnesium_polylepis.1